MFGGRGSDQRLARVADRWVTFVDLPVVVVQKRYPVTSIISSSTISTRGRIM